MEPVKEATIKAQFEELIKRHGLYGRVDIEHYYTSDHYFEKHSDIYDSSECWFEDVEVDRMLWITHDRPAFKDDYAIEDINILEPVEDFLSMNEIKLKNENIGEYTLAGIKAELTEKQYKDMIAAVWDYIAGEWDFNDCVDTGLFEGDVEEQFNELEALAYWTIYFEPSRMDEETAHDCGLLPFTFKGINLLALCACGMDLSPKLDAYQALVSNTLPESSMFFRQRDYFESVVGKEITLRVENACKRERPMFKIFAE